MSISITPDQQDWINARVARGDFDSVQDALHQLLDDRIMELSIKEDDLAWAKPLVDEALAQADRGECLTREEHQARIPARLAALRDQ